MINNEWFMKFPVNNWLGIFFISKVLFWIDKLLNLALLMLINKRSLSFHIELNMMVHKVVLKLLRALLKSFSEQKNKIFNHDVCFHLPDLNNRITDSIMQCYVVRAHWRASYQTSWKLWGAR